jgi:hypothetical protein
VGPTATRLRREQRVVIDDAAADILAALAKHDSVDAERKRVARAAKDMPLARKTFRDAARLIADHIGADASYGREALSQLTTIRRELFSAIHENSLLSKYVASAGGTQRLIEVPFSSRAAHRPKKEWLGIAVRPVQHLVDDGFTIDEACLAVAARFTSVWTVWMRRREPLIANLTQKQRRPLTGPTGRIKNVALARNIRRAYFRYKSR